MALVTHISMGEVILKPSWSIGQEQISVYGTGDSTEQIAPSVTFSDSRPSLPPIELHPPALCTLYRTLPMGVTW